jgi:hypothetical protein
VEWLNPHIRLTKQLVRQGMRVVPFLIVDLGYPGIDEDLGAFKAWPESTIEGRIFSTNSMQCGCDNGIQLGMN